MIIDAHHHLKRGKDYLDLLRKRPGSLTKLSWAWYIHLVDEVGLLRRLAK